MIKIFFIIIIFLLAWKFLQWMTMEGFRSIKHIHWLQIRPKDILKTVLVLGAVIGLEAWLPSLSVTGLEPPRELQPVKYFETQKWSSQPVSYAQASRNALWLPSFTEEVQNKLKYEMKSKSETSKKLEARKSKLEKELFLIANKESKKEKNKNKSTWQIYQEVRDANPKLRDEDTRISSRLYALKREVEFLPVRIIEPNVNAAVPALRHAFKLFEHRGKFQKNKTVTGFTSNSFTKLWNSFIAKMRSQHRPELSEEKARILSCGVTVSDTHEQPPVFQRVCELILPIDINYDVTGIKCVVDANDSNEINPMASFVDACVESWIHPTLNILISNSEWTFIEPSQSGLSEIIPKERRVSGWVLVIDGKPVPLDGTYTLKRPETDAAPPKFSLIHMPLSKVNDFIDRNGVPEFDTSDGTTRWWSNFSEEFNTAKDWEKAMHLYPKEKSNFKSVVGLTFVSNIEGSIAGQFTGYSSKEMHQFGGFLETAYKRRIDIVKEYAELGDASCFKRQYRPLSSMVDFTLEVRNPELLLLQDDQKTRNCERINMILRILFDLEAQNKIP